MIWFIIAAVIAIGVGIYVAITEDLGSGVCFTLILGVCLLLAATIVSGICVDETYFKVSEHEIETITNKSNNHYEMMIDENVLVEYPVDHIINADVKIPMLIKYSTKKKITSLTFNEYIVKLPEGTDITDYMDLNKGDE